MFILIAYDISSTKRRVKVEKLLSSFGFRVNYSLFEFNISKTKYKILLNKLKELSNREDNIRIYIQTLESIKKSFVLNSKIKPFEFENGYIE